MSGHDLLQDLLLSCCFDLPLAQWLSRNTLNTSDMVQLPLLDLPRCCHTTCLAAAA